MSLQPRRYKWLLAHIPHGIRTCKDMVHGPNFNVRLVVAAMLLITT